MSIDFNIILSVFKLVASRNKNLLFNKIDAGNFLSDRVLNLETRVHFQEVEVLVCIHQELDSTGGVIVARTSKSYCLVSHLFTGNGVHSWARCLLDDLLVTTLH